MRRFDSEQRIESYPVISNLTASEVLIGMDDKTRLRILTDAHINVPARATSFNETQDPFGLLEHRDTYEVFAEQIFSECEGVYRTIAKENPKVLKTVYKAKNGDSTIELPTVSLGSLFNFHMVRSIEGRSTQFSFTRTDEGYESSGFLVMQNDSGHFVLKNIAQGETDIKNDVNYFHLLQKSQKWIHDYSAALSISPNKLQSTASLELKNFNIKKSVGGLALGSKNIFSANRNNPIMRGLTAFFTKPRKSFNFNPVANEKMFVEVEGPRRPRYSAILLAALVLTPTSTHTDVAESMGAAIIDAPHSISNLKNRIFDRTILEREAFDKEGLSFPDEAGSMTLRPSQQIDLIPESTKLSKNVAVNAPDWASMGSLTNGTLINHSIRHLTGLNLTYEDGFDGLKAGDCIDTSGDPTMYSFNTPIGTKLLFLNKNSYSSGDLSIKATNDSMDVCNTSKTDLNADALTGVYVQTNFPNR